MWFLYAACAGTSTIDYQSERAPSLHVHHTYALVIGKLKLDICSLVSSQTIFIWEKDRKEFSMFIGGKKTSCRWSHTCTPENGIINTTSVLFGTCTSYLYLGVYAFEVNSISDILCQSITWISSTCESIYMLLA